MTEPTIEQMTKHFTERATDLQTKTDETRRSALFDKFLIASLLGLGAGGVAAYATRESSSSKAPILESEEDKLKRQQEQQLLQGVLTKQANPEAEKSIIPQFIRDAFGSVTDTVTDYVDEATTETSAENSKWRLPLQVAGAGIGGYAGYSLLKSYLENREKEKQIADIKKRREALNNLLVDDLSTPQIEKAASWNDAIGVYLAAALGLGGVGYYYGAGVGKDVDKRLEEIKVGKNKLALSGNSAPAIPVLEPLEREALPVDTSEVLEEEEKEDEPVNLSTSADEPEAPRPVLVNNTNNTHGYADLLGGRRQELLKASSLFRKA